MGKLKRSESLPNRLHSCKTILQRYYKRRKEYSYADVNSDHNLLVPQVQTRLKPIKKLEKIKMECGKVKNKENFKEAT